MLGFFCQLPLSRSQADALLRQLAQHWDGEFDLLCGLIAHAAVVYMDETGWKIGSEGCSLWAFASKLQRVFLFGCRKDDATLDQMLPPEVFDGIGAVQRSAGRHSVASPGGPLLSMDRPVLRQRGDGLGDPADERRSFEKSASWPIDRNTHRCR